MSPLSSSLLPNKFMFLLYFSFLSQDNNQTLPNYQDRCRDSNLHYHKLLMHILDIFYLNFIFLWFLSLSLSIYIYIYRERERERNQRNIKFVSIYLKINQVSIKWIVNIKKLTLSFITPLLFMGWFFLVYGWQERWVYEWWYVFLFFLFSFFFFNEWVKKEDKFLRFFWREKFAFRF